MNRVAVTCAALALTAVLAALPAGCTPAPAGPKPITIGLVVPSLTHPFFIYLQRSVEEEAGELGVRVIAADAGNLAAKQMAIVEDFGSSGLGCELRKKAAGVPPLGGTSAEIPPKGGTPARLPAGLHPRPEKPIYITPVAIDKSNLDEAEPK
jgi:hypothetical protein